MGRLASVGGWVHRWVAGWLGCGCRSALFFFFFPVVGCGLWCGGSCDCVGRSVSVGGWAHWWVVGLRVGLWVDQCVRGGGSGGFHGGGCGPVGLVGVDLVDFFFFVVGCGGGGVSGCGCGCVCGYDVCM